ncbi:MAG TPA: hypothetical protein VMB80_00170 [Candidatus Acidoferrum sp.]|nr:hypothetical protein [Candidatus Acidoferrum sp.]
MKKSLKMGIILMVLILEMVWVTRPLLSRRGYAREGDYRRKERYAAWVAWSRHPSPATQAAFDAEVIRLDNHVIQKQWIIFTVLLLLNGLGIYKFLTYDACHSPLKMRSGQAEG